MRSEMHQNCVHFYTFFVRSKWRWSSEKYIPNVFVDLCFPGSFPRRKLYGRSEYPVYMYAVENMTTSTGGSWNQKWDSAGHEKLLAAWLCHGTKTPENFNHWGSTKIFNVCYHCDFSRIHLYKLILFIDIDSQMSCSKFHSLWILVRVTRHLTFWSAPHWLVLTITLYAQVTTGVFT